jgi:hypothetical protein
MTGEILFGPSYVRVGVTGTRKGCTHPQLLKLTSALRLLREFRLAEYLHHGDCLGVDYQAAVVGRDLGYKIVCHPPVLSGLRAWFPSHEERDPAPYHDRDRALVDEVELLVAVPKTDIPTPRSGTWFTVGYAQETGVRVAIIRPDGTWIR